MILSFQGNSRAGLQQDLEDMFKKWGFLATGSTPGAYMAQKRGMIIGGTLNARAKVEPIQLFTIKLPYFKAGCGGIDLYFGGISFINAQEFKNLLTAIGQNAIGYAFQLGLEAVCPTCNEELKNLVKKIQDWQKMFTDTCTAAKNLVDWGLGSLKGEINKNFCVQDCVASGTDPHICQINCSDTKTTAQRIKKIVTQAESQGKLPPVQSPGIAAVKALQGKGIGKDEIETIMSVAGTFVCNIDPNTDDSTMACKYYPPTLKLQDFIYGNEKAKIYTYNSPDDTSLATKEINLKGLYLEAVSNIQKIAQKIVNHQPIPDDSEEGKFINASIVPVYSFLTRASRVPGLLDITQDVITDVTVIGMATAKINQYIHTLEASVADQTVVNPSEFARAIRDVKEEIYQEFMKEFNNFEARLKIYQLAEFFIREVNKLSRYGLWEKK